MRFLKVKDPKDVVKLFPWLVPTETETRMDIACELCDRLKDKPEDTFVMVAIERGITRAILIAHVSDKRKKRVWVWQSGTERGFKHQRLMFDALKGWAKAKGCKQLRTKVSNPRWSRILHRRYGFRPKGQEMIYNVA